MTATRLRLALLHAAAALLAATLAHAQTVPEPTPSPAKEEAAALEARKQASARELERLAAAQALSGERAREIEAEIAAIRKDHASLSAALVQAAKTERKLGEEATAIGARLDELGAQEEVLRASLAERRGVLAEVLGALQRMGLNPPPAILVRPEDALASVRSSILLAAVVPELRGETEVLIGDLRELARIVATIEGERERLLETVAGQAAEQRRLSLLLEEKRQLQTRSEEMLASEQARAAELAAEATSLRELIDALEGEIEIATLRAEEEARAAEAAARAAEEAARAAKEAARLAELEATRKAEEEARQAAEAARQAAEEARVAQEQARAAEEEARQAALQRRNTPPPAGTQLPFPSSGQIFSAMLGQIDPPVPGQFRMRFGDSDGNGGTMQGDMLATHSAAIVTAPVDGSVLYGGPFRSYGQLLILNAGDGYHIVLAGMGRISVSPGQSVLAGEPVGLMGEARMASAVAFGDENAGPELYVEFRKEGKPVDPAPWWTERNSGRTGNDT